jgi:hypothetical protein
MAISTKVVDKLLEAINGLKFKRFGRSPDLSIDEPEGSHHEHGVYAYCYCVYSRPEGV